jgi:threonine synthase
VHAIGQLAAKGMPTAGAPVFSTPSGNFGNLTAGLMAKRSGVSIGRFVAATNANDVVPEYLATGRFEPRPSIHTVANAMDVGNPSNFDRLLWLYGADLDAIRTDVTGSRHDDDEVRATIRKVHEERGYLLDPHSAIAYLGLKSYLASGVSRAPSGQVGQVGPGVFLATAHPAKFAEIVEPVIGRTIPKPQPLVDALATQRKILEIDATFEAIKNILD